MTIKILVSSAIVSALISVIGSIITTAMANKAATKTAKETTNNEIERLKLTWDREDIVSSDDEFAEMAASSAKFVQYNSPTLRSEAMAKVAAVRSKESLALGEKLDSLYSAIKRNNQPEADECLTAAINEKRKIKGERSAK